MKVLVSCDHVFDVLTRGPFPTGESGDEAIERHLRACHDCRQLAEALRPAVELLHEAVARDESLALPEYQGSLPVASRRRAAATADEPRPLSLALRKVHPRKAPTNGRGDRQDGPVERRTLTAGQGFQRRLTGAIRLLAASILIGALVTLGWGLVTTDPDGARTANFPRPTLDEQGLITLASLKLPATCVPAQLGAARPGLPISAKLQAELACCTGCHAAGKTHRLDGQQFALLEKSCVACHRS